MKLHSILLIATVLISVCFAADFVTYPDSKQTLETFSTSSANLDSTTLLDNDNFLCSTYVVTTETSLQIASGFSQIVVVKKGKGYFHSDDSRTENLLVTEDDIVFIRDSRVFQYVNEDAEFSQLVACYGPGMAETELVEDDVQPRPTESELESLDNNDGGDFGLFLVIGNSNIVELQDSYDNQPISATSVRLSFDNNMNIYSFKIDDNQDYASHSGSDMIAYVVHNNVKSTVLVNGANTETSLNEGDYFYIPAGNPYQFINEGDDPAFVLAYYSPALSFGDRNILSFAPSSEETVESVESVASVESVETAPSVSVDSADSVSMDSFDDSDVSSSSTVLFSVILSIGVFLSLLF